LKAHGVSFGQNAEHRVTWKGHFPRLGIKKGGRKTWFWTCLLAAKETKKLEKTGGRPHKGGSAGPDREKSRAAGNGNKKGGTQFSQEAPLERPSGKEGGHKVSSRFPSSSRLVGGAW